MSAKLVMILMPAHAARAMLHAMAPGPGQHVRQARVAMRTQTVRASAVTILHGNAIHDDNEITWGTYVARFSVFDSMNIF